MKTMTMKLGRAIKQLQYQNQRRLESGLRDIDTTLAQWDALRAIKNNPGASAHALAEETFQTDQSFGTLANRLLAKECITRQQGVGRALFYELTETGQSVLKDSVSVANQAIEDSLKNLNAEERQQLLSLIEKALADNKFKKA